VDDLLVLDVFGRATVPDGTADAEPEDLAPALEALCFALGREVSIAEAAATLDRSASAVTNAAAVLAMQLRGRGLMLQRSAESVQLVTRPEMAWAVQRGLHPERPSRLSRAAMETLAIIAYRQPATKAVIESIRGVDCEAVLEHLTERGLIDEIARQDSPGHPRLFGTTLRFLQLVGLERIEDLPPVSEGATLPILE
jgi:segregation and condensation protein B